MPKQNITMGVFPVEGGYWFNNSFDEKRGKGKHVSIDIFGKRTATVVSPFIFPGEVIETTTEEETPKGGNTVTIKYTIDNFTFYAYYAHLDEVFVFEGRIVNMGDMIGTLGRSGNASGPDGVGGTRCHLHLNLYKIYGNDKHSFINPYKELLAIADKKLKMASKCKKDPEKCEWCGGH